MGRPDLMDYTDFMSKLIHLSKGGQITLPAEIRHRWKTTRFLLQDSGDQVIIEPLPDDPIEAACGIFAGPGPTATEIKEMLRKEDIAAEERKFGA